MEPSSNASTVKAAGKKYAYTLPHYNGFSHEQRVAVNPIQKRLLRDGTIKQPTECSICGFSRPGDLTGQGYIYTHLEDYSDATAVLPTCKKCHADLHARFRDQGRWEKALYKHYQRGRWFTLLSMSPDSQYRPFNETYPLGLPGPYEAWGEEKWPMDIAPLPDMERLL